MPLPKMRGLAEAIEEIRAADPKTALTLYTLRRLVKSGVIPSVRAGTKYLVNMAVLEEYMQKSIDTENAECTAPYVGIRRVK